MATSSDASGNTGVSSFFGFSPRKPSPTSLGLGLEDERRDLFVGGKRIEFKFNWDLCEDKLAKEFAKHGDDVEEMWRRVKAKEIKGASWGVMPKIFEDWCVRQPDVFVWIICSRDLTAVPAAALQRICRGPEQLQANARRPYDPAGSFLVVADTFCKKLHAIRPFALRKEGIETRADFPSTYHFWIFESAGPEKEVRHGTQ